MLHPSKFHPFMNNNIIWIFCHGVRSTWRRIRNLAISPENNLSESQLFAKKIKNDAFAKFDLATTSTKWRIWPSYQLTKWRIWSADLLGQLTFLTKWRIRHCLFGQVTNSAKLRIVQVTRTLFLIFAIINYGMMRK